MKLSFVLIVSCHLLIFSGANTCDQYRAISTTVSDAWCRTVACQELCGENDRRLCMKNFPQCQEYSANSFLNETIPVPLLPVKISSEKSVPIQQAPAERIPEECASWGSPCPERDQWCRDLACQECRGLEKLPYQDCLRHQSQYCHFHKDSDSDFKCVLWSGHVKRKDEFCIWIACPKCNRMLEKQKRKHCREIYEGFCNTKETLSACNRPIIPWSGTSPSLDSGPGNALSRPSRILRQIISKLPRRLKSNEYRNSSCEFSNTEFN